MQAIVFILISFKLWSVDYHLVTQNYRPIERVKGESLIEFQIRRSAWINCQDIMLLDDSQKDKIETYKCYYSEVLKKSAGIGYNVKQLKNNCNRYIKSDLSTIEKSIKQLLCEHNRACEQKKIKFQCLANPLDRHLASVLRD